MSDYKGKNFRRFQNQNRSRETQGGRASQSGRETNGDRDARATSTPYLNEISATHMERYIESVHQFALSSKEHATVASWIRGRIPIVMLEHELPRTKERLLGLQAKHHILPDGLVSPVSLTAGEVRAKLIKTTMDENRMRRLAKDTNSELGVSSKESESNSSGSKKDTVVGRAKDSGAKIGGSSMDAEIGAKGSKAEPDSPSTVTDDQKLKEEALRDLFPDNAKTSRESERSKLEISASTLLSKMVYVWPSKDIRTKMQASKALVEAFENTDVIRFIEELKVFALSGTGNSETNREVAEAHLSNLKMKPGKALDYFKDYTEAVEHIRVCNSTFTEHKVVDLFFRHLDQSSFPGWYIKFLTHDDVMYTFQKRTFEEAKDYALRYHDTVIRMSETVYNKNSGENMKTGPIKSVNQLKSALAGTGTAKTPIAVDPVVLATLVQQASEATKKRKAGEKPGDKTGAKDEGEVAKKIKAENIAAEKKICWKFRDTGKCEYGSNCHFAHTK